MDNHMTIHFLGVGSAFTTTEYFQSNLLITAANGKKMLVDCGSDARFSLAEWGSRNGQVNPVIDAVYFSHLHADHIGGLEWLAFSTYFNPNVPRPKLFGVAEILDQLWDNALRSGLEYIDDKVTTLADYFDLCAVETGVPFHWENIEFTPIKMLHVRNSHKNVHSFGLIIKEDGASPLYFFSSDTVFDASLVRLLEEWAPQASHVFIDTETTLFRTHVHAHYEELLTLPQSMRKKIWLYHYSPNPNYDPQKDGFMGFVKKGQSFS